MAGFFVAMFAIGATTAAFGIGWALTKDLNRRN